MSSRRKFISASVGAVAGALATSRLKADEISEDPYVSEIISLCGEWLFRTDPDDQGAKNNWHSADSRGEGWRSVTVPHTWQIAPQLADYRGVAWYWRTFDLPATYATASLPESAVRVEFEAVFHSAAVWVNGQLAGEHAHKGYTAFALDITNLLHSAREQMRLPSAWIAPSTGTCCLAVDRATGRTMAAFSVRCNS